MIRTILRHLLKPLYSMNSLGVDNMNDFESRVEGSRCSEEIRSMVEMNDYGS